MIVFPNKGTPISSSTSIIVPPTVTSKKDTPGLGNPQIPEAFQGDFWGIWTWDLRAAYASLGKQFVSITAATNRLNMGQGKEGGL